MNKEKIKKILKVVASIMIALCSIYYIYRLGVQKTIFILIGLFIISSIIFIHELGHFLVAKSLKIPVYEFSVGIGTKLFSKKIRETDYCIRCVPLGGYVVLEDEENEGEVESTTGNTPFRQIHPFKRFLVIIAGPIFNFILAFIILFGIYFASGYPSTTIGELDKNGSAQEYGLKVGDTILSINNIKIDNWYVVPALTNQNKDLEFKIKRDNKIETISIKPKLNKETNTYSIGIGPECKKDFFKSISSGFKSTIYNIKATAQGYVKIFTDMFSKNKESEVQLSGPIGTIQIVSEQTKQGFESTLLTVVSLTLSIGIFNLLPVIPNLDGGRLLFILIEILRGGKQLKEETELNILSAGAYIMIGLFIFVTFSDIKGLFL